MRRVLSFTSMMISASLFVIFMLATAVPEMVSSFFPHMSRLSEEVVRIGMVVSFLFFICSGILLRIAKEAEEFNEFGVRKRGARRRLSSYNREKVEARQLSEIERIISASELKKTLHRGSKDPETDLSKMIGMESVKQKVRELQARMEFDLTSKKTDASKEMHHMVFYGAPGTGKTTVARIIAGIMYEYGYIKVNRTMEVDGNFLKGPDAADTQKKVRIILSKIKGGILFIDEAYALTQSGDASGQQAIATLIKEMEDSRGEIIVIFAGYSEEMSDMLNANPGFRSRIKDYIDFPDYNDSELKDIAILMAEERGFSIDTTAFDTLVQRFIYERKESTWGNGRTVRNIIEESIDRHALNYKMGILSKKDKYKICPCDVNCYPQKHI